MCFLFSSIPVCPNILECVRQRITYRVSFAPLSQIVNLLEVTVLTPCFTQCVYCLNPAPAVSRRDIELFGSNLRQPTCSNLELRRNQCRHYLRLSSTAKAPIDEALPRSIPVPTPQQLFATKLPGNLWKQRWQQNTALKTGLRAGCDEAVTRVIGRRTRHPSRHRHTCASRRRRRCTDERMENAHISSSSSSALGRCFISEGHRDSEHRRDAR